MMKQSTFLPPPKPITKPATKAGPIKALQLAQALREKEAVDRARKAELAEKNKSKAIFGQQKNKRKLVNNTTASSATTEVSKKKQKVEDVNMFDLV